jgi:hypothetical protein
MGTLFTSPCHNIVTLPFACFLIFTVAVFIWNSELTKIVSIIVCAVFGDDTVDCRPTFNTVALDSLYVI